MLERECNRIADIAVEAVNATAVHVGRMAAALCDALDRTKRELGDLAWDYSELAASVRRSARSSSAATDQHAQTAESQEIADVISIGLRRRKAN